jgi:phosphate transport system substrate-binding protein
MMRGDSARRRGRFLAPAILFLLASSSAWGEPPSVDAGLPAYRAAGGVAGNLNAVGSDTLNNLMTLWSEAFRRRYPSVRVQVEGKGSSTAPPALISAAAQLGPMSRPMKSSEREAFEKRFGYPPTPLRVAIDALAVYVHPSNPVQKLTLPQVDAIFSKSRLCGLWQPIVRWGDLGLGGDWKERPIRLYGRNSASGTYGYFKKHALCKGDYRDSVKEQPGSASVVQAVATDPAGVGYSGIGYKTSGVKTVALATEEAGTFFGTDAEEVISGEYPLARFLYVYVNRAPGKALDPLVREFVVFVLSREGQQIVIKDGYLPLSAGLAAEEMTKIR